MLRCTVHGGLGCQRGRQGRFGDRPFSRQGAGAGGLVRDRAQALIRAGGIGPRIKPNVRPPHWHVGAPLCVRPPLGPGRARPARLRGVWFVGSRPKPRLGGPCGQSESD